MSSASPKGSEPSMEEILASIRRIIADDQPAKPPAPTAAPEPEAEATPAPLEDDILDLDDEPEEADADDIVFGDRPETELETADEPEPLPPPAPPPLLRAPEREWRTPEPHPDALLSRKTDAVVGHAFQSLAGSILAGSQKTIDDVVRELLRPMLKEWLDDNLPGIVERLVRAEIERVARGGR